MIEVIENDNAVSFRVRVQPRASRSEAAGEHAGALKLRLTSPPVEGRANDECVRLLSRLLDVPRSAVEIVSGATSRDKLIRVRGESSQRVKAALDRATSRG